MCAKIYWSSKKLVLLTLAALMLLASAVYPISRAAATPGSGVTGEVLASGTLPQEVPAKFKAPTGNIQMDVSQISVIRYTIIPGGVFGWHQHGGPLWATVVSGSLTVYHGHDPKCEADVYPAGSVFLDPGNHTHNARNEGQEDLVVMVTYMLPEGATPRIDVDNPGYCPFRPLDFNATP